MRLQLDVDWAVLIRGLEDPLSWWLSGLWCQQSVPLHASVSIGCLSICMAWLLASPKARGSTEPGGGCKALYDLSLEVTVEVYHFYCVPFGTFFIQCGRRLPKV